MESAYFGLVKRPGPIHFLRGLIPPDADRVENAAYAGGRIGAGRVAGNDRSRFDTHDFRVHFAGVFPFAPGNFGEDGVSGGVNVSGLEARAGVGDVLSHRFFGPRGIGGADENRESETDARAGAAFARNFVPGFAARKFELKSDLIAAARRAGYANDLRGRFGLRGSRLSVVWESDPDARMKVAAFDALDEHSAAANVDGLRGFKTHAERAAPAEPGRKVELRARMGAQFGWDRYAIHSGHRSLGARVRQTEANVERRCGT